MTLTREQAERGIENTVRLACGCQSAAWMGITVEWRPLPKRDGGDIKRGKVWGRLVYTYDGQELSREEAIEEVLKPPELRRALRLVMQVRECSLCGYVVAGEEAENALMGIVYRNGQRIEQKHWRCLSYGEHMIQLCPHCLDEIVEGKFGQERPR